MRWVVPALLLLFLVASCESRETHVLEGLHRVDWVIRERRPYAEVVARIDDARKMREAELVPYAIAQRRFSATLIYDRPIREVESALRERLTADDDPVGRARAAGAAYATYPRLKPYFDAAVADLEAAPRTPVIERALESAARIRTRMESAGGAPPEANRRPWRPW